MVPVQEGQKIRLKGMGVEGKDGGKPGALYLNVRIRRPLLQKVSEFLKIQLSARAEARFSIAVRFSNLFRQEAGMASMPR